MNLADLLLSIFSSLVCTTCFQVVDVSPTHTDLFVSDHAVQEDIPAYMLEKVPAELSVAHFSRMRLEGDDLQLVSTLDDNSSYIRYQISYTSNGLLISGILNIPKGDGPFPLLLLNHGYIPPSVYTNGRGLKREQDYFARQGFAVLHSDYRGHAFSDPSPDTRNIYDAGLEYSMDVVNAVSAIQKSELTQIDTKRVGMLGHSMGGGIALNIAVAHRSVIDAVILYAPVHSDAYKNFQRWRALRDDADVTWEAMGSREQNPKGWDALSSWTYLTYIDDPILLFHGTDDADVPVDWTRELHEELQLLQKDSTYIEYADEGHEFIQEWSDFMEKSATFLKESL